jgi:hypothetical protein
MLTDQQIIEQLRRELAALRPRSDLIEHLREATDADRDNGHERRPEHQRSAPRRRPRMRVGMLLPTAIAVVAIGIAVGALTLLRHRAGAPATTANHAHRTTTDRDRPPAVSAAQVAASLMLRALPVGHYCNARSMRLIICPAGQRPVAAEPQRLVEIAFTARRAAGGHSWYSWDLTAPHTHACAQASQGGPTRGAVRAGTRVVFDGLIAPGCSGTVNAEVFYWTHALSTDTERSALVGRRTLRLP